MPSKKVIRPPLIDFSMPKAIAEEVAAWRDAERDAGRDTPLDAPVDAPVEGAPHVVIRRSRRVGPVKVHPELVGRTRICDLPTCGAPYTARPGETLDQWMRRRTCRPAHARALARLQLGHLAGAPLPAGWKEPRS